MDMLLVKRAQKGDTEAFIQLVENHKIYLQMKHVEIQYKNGESYVVEVKAVVINDITIPMQ